MKHVRIAVVLLVVATWFAPAHGETSYDPLFWKVGSPRGTAYLLGTIHFGTSDLYPLPATIRKAFAESDILIEEVADMASADKMAQQLLSKAVYPKGDSLANHLSKPTTDRLAAYLRKAGNIEREAFGQLKPWAVSLLLLPLLETKRLGLDPALGIDRHLAQQAEKTGKTVIGLETAEFQLRLFTSMNSLSDEMQEQLMVVSLRQLATDDMQRLVRAWKLGNARDMEQVVTRYVDEYPVLQPVLDKMLYDRNNAMTDKIDRFLQQSKRYFVAVGAAHLIGDRGIAKQLEARGYKVERLSAESAEALRPAPAPR